MGPVGHRSAENALLLKRGSYVESERQTCLAFCVNVWGLPGWVKT